MNHDEHSDDVRSWVAHRRDEAQHTHIHLHLDEPTLHALRHLFDARFGEIVELLTQVQQQGAKIMATLTDLQAAVTAEDTVIDSAITLLNGLAAQVAALAPNQAAIDALAADISAKTASLAESVTKNTPNPPAAPTVAVATP